MMETEERSRMRGQGADAGEDVFLEVPARDREGLTDVQVREVEDMNEKWRISWQSGRWCK